MLDTEAGETDFRIGDQRPAVRGRCALLGTLPASNLTVVTSGTYERYFIADGKKYHYILDSQTGYPTDTDVLSATIIAAKGRSVDCDGLSTTCLALGIENALALVNSIEGVEAILVDQTGRCIRPARRSTSQKRSRGVQPAAQQDRLRSYDRQRRCRARACSAPTNQNYDKTPAFGFAGALRRRW